MYAYLHHADQVVAGDKRTCLTCRAFLRTLDQRNLSNGSAEMLKMACIKDAPLFKVLEAHGSELIARHFQSDAASVAMRRSIQGMVRRSFALYHPGIITGVQSGCLQRNCPRSSPWASGPGRWRLLNTSGCNCTMCLWLQQ